MSSVETPRRGVSTRGGQQNRQTPITLKENGRLIGAVPFLARIHFDPDDHFRYTHSTLKRAFADAGYREIVVTPLGYGPFVAAAAYIAPIVRIKLLIFLLYLLAIGLDKLAQRIFAHSELVKAENFPLSYFFVCTK